MKLAFVLTQLLALILSQAATAGGWRTRSEYYAIHCILSKGLGQPTGCMGGGNAVKDWRSQTSNAKSYWNSVGNFTILRAHEQNQTSCSCSGTGINPPNLIIAEAGYPSEQGYYAYVSWDFDADGYLINADMIFSPSELPNIGDGTGGTANVYSILLHEFGHFLDLPDEYSNTSSIMYYTYGNRTTIAQFDINNLAQIYPAQQQEPSEGGENHCGSSTMLMLHPFRSQLLQEMREIRDGWLSATESGRALIKAYYEFSPELVGYAMRHPFWAIQAASKLSKLVPLFSSPMNQRPKTTSGITAQDVDDVLLLLDRARSEASPKLRAFLDRLTPKIEKGRAYDPFALLSAIL